MFLLIFQTGDCFWIEDLNLKESDKIAIQSGDCLNDHHMHAAHEMLRKQFPHVDGLQSTLLCQNDGLIPIQPGAGFCPSG